jgi:hypothetical protein
MQTPGVYRRQVDIPAFGRSTLDLSCDCPGVPAINRTVYFYVSGFAIEE